MTLPSSLCERIAAAEHAACMGDSSALSAALGEPCPDSRIIARHLRADGHSLFFSALESYSGEAETLLCIELLAQHGADPCLPNPKGFTPLHLAALNILPHCVDALLRFGADPDATDIAHYRPIHFAASSGPSLNCPACLSILASLAAAGADLMARTLQGTRPIDIALSPHYAFSAHAEPDDTFIATLMALDERAQLGLASPAPSPGRKPLAL